MFEINYFALILFIVSTSFSPGPNNILLLSSGIKFGLRNTLSHISGVLVGFHLMLLILGLFLHFITTINTTIFYIFSYLGIIYLLYLSYKVIFSNSKLQESDFHQPITFIQALLFQWVNPKAWVMILSVLTTFTTATESFYQQLFVIITLFIFFGIINCFTWAGLGGFIKVKLSSQKHLRYINTLLGLMLLFAIVQMIPDKL